MQWKLGSRSVIGSLLLVAACADQGIDTSDDLDTIARRAGGPTRTTTSDNECRGESIAPASLSAQLSVDPLAGLATVILVNHTETDHYPKVKLALRKSGGDRTTPIEVDAGLVPGGGTGLVRIPLSSIELDPTMPEQLLAEIAIPDAAGEIIERTFARAEVGPSVDDVASRLGIRVSKKTKLAAISEGGPSAVISSFEPTHDTIDEIAENPNLPLPDLTYDMCLRWPVTLVDAGFGEDYGVDPTSPWIARGGRVAILQNGQTLFDGYLDANGCTGEFQATSSVNFMIYGQSRARVAGNDVIVRDDEGKDVTFVIAHANPGANKHPVYVFPEVAPITTMLAVGAYTVQKFNGGMTGKSIPIEHRCNPVPNGCCNCASGGGIWLDDFGADKKFAIAHELGHRILALYTGGFLNDDTFDLDPNDVIQTCDTSTDHALWSMEYDSAAAMEGWAHFVAAATFNDRAGDNPGGMFRYWSSTNTVDIEQSSTGFPSNYYDTVCSTIAISLSTKMGVELDWLRHFWDYYTNALNTDPGVRPSFTQMMAEIDAAPVWIRDTAWESIRQGVSSYSGAQQLARWDQHGAWNGVD